jgi:hypothetical protein
LLLRRGKGFRWVSVPQSNRLLTSSLFRKVLNQDKSIPAA